MIDEEQLAAYVKALGSEYNTAYTKRKFKTSYGPEAEVAECMDGGLMEQERRRRG